MVALTQMLFYFPLTLCIIDVYSCVFMHNHCMPLFVNCGTLILRKNNRKEDAP